MEKYEKQNVILEKGDYQHMVTKLYRNPQDIEKQLNAWNHSYFDFNPDLFDSLIETTEHRIQSEYRTFNDLLIPNPELILSEFVTLSDIPKLKDLKTKIEIYRDEQKKILIDKPNPIGIDRVYKMALLNELGVIDHLKKLIPNNNSKLAELLSLIIGNSQDNIREDLTYLLPKHKKSILNRKKVAEYVNSIFERMGINKD